MHAQAQPVTATDLRTLADEFEASGQPFSSYLFNLAYYHLSANSAGRLEAGLNALDACILTGHFDEAEQVLRLLAADFPEYASRLRYAYAYVLLRAGRFTAGDVQLRTLPDTTAGASRVWFMRAYAHLHANRTEQALQALNRIDSAEFAHPDALHQLTEQLRTPPPGARKYVALALPLSAVVPGAGQLYTGHYYDALRSFGFNLLTGYAAFASWRYEFSLDRTRRSYVLPVLSTLAWLSFYVTNLYNAVNDTQKANLHRDRVHFNQILQHFDVVLQDRAYFIQLQFGF